MKKAFFVTLVVAIMLVSVFGTLSVTAQSSDQSALSTTKVTQASFSGSYSGYDKIAGTADVVSTTRGTFSGSATLTFNGKTITGEGSGLGKGQVFGTGKGHASGPYPTEIQLTLKCKAQEEIVDGTFSVDVTIPGAGTQHLEGPFQGTFVGNTITVPWSDQIEVQQDGITLISYYEGLIEFVVAPPVQ